MVQDNNKQGMPGDIKGKGIASSLNNVSSSISQDDCSNSTQASAHTIPIMSRISASAGKLTGDMILRHHNGAQIANALPSGKAESSSRAQNGSIQGASTYRSRTDTTAFGGIFKSVRSQAQSTPEHSGFSSFLDGTSVPEITGLHDTGKYANEQDCDHEPRQIPQASVIIATDGMDVVNLLDSGYDKLDETAAQLTNDEKATLRHHLFEDGSNPRRNSSERGRWEDALNFFPNFESPSNSAQELAGLLGTSDLAEARHIWISQWQWVLSSYTDEVWGDLGSLVNVAREELASISSSLENTPSKPKALRRLQQILNHIRGM